jgi:hypothetical protein
MGVDWRSYRRSPALAIVLSIGVIIVWTVPRGPH